MAKGVKARVKVPKTAAAGETVTIKTLITHKMESGQRKDSDGNKIPQSIINRFTCTFNGNTVIDVKMAAAISTNPYFAFDAVVPEAGDFNFAWYDDDGDIYPATKSVKIA
jgi:sulfur-oxidizing protein SoxZ